MLSGGCFGPPLFRFSAFYARSAQKSHDITGGADLRVRRNPQSFFTESNLGDFEGDFVTGLGGTGDTVQNGLVVNNLG